LGVDLSQLTDEELVAMIGALSIDVRATPMKTIEGSASLQPSGSEGPTYAKTTDGTS